MDRFPLSEYDILGYMAPGVVLLVGVEAILTENKPFITFPGSQPGGFFDLVLTLLVSFLVGQMIAGIASFLYEDILVKRGLKSPNINLFATEKKRSLFPGYFRALPDITRNEILDKAFCEIKENILDTAKANSFQEAVESFKRICAGESPKKEDKAKAKEVGETLFEHAFAKVKQDKDKMERLNIFLKLYGFCRNGSLACLLLFGFILARHLMCISQGRGEYHAAWVLLICAVILFYRYLRFYRHYSWDMFLAYKESCEF
jgi:hypothetical protein